MSLETFCDEIVAKAVIDVDSQEVRDIASALEELLHRYVKKMSENKETNTGFKLLYLQQCGSMAEKTSLWKSVRRKGRERKFIEFDYLAVMENDEKTLRISEGPCRGCRHVEKSSEQIIVSAMNKIYFHDPLYRTISSLCLCSVEQFRDLVSLSDMSNVCLICKSVRDTGYLQMAKTFDFNHQKIKRNESCSLVFYWISWTNSLTAPDIDSLQMTEKINRLVIRVDFLPAFEIKPNPGIDLGYLNHTKQLIVAKKCSVCRNPGWMFSYSMFEVDSLLQMDNFHRKCFVFIKFLYGQLIFWADGDQYLKSYYSKVAFLNHFRSCTDTNDSARCVVDVLRSLLDMYISKTLKVHITDLELHLPESVMVLEIAANFMLCLMHILTEMKTYVKSKQSKEWCMLDSKDCIALIKNTVQMLQDGKLWLDTSNGEWALEKREVAPVSSSRYVRFLLCHQDISLRITSAAVRSMKPRRLLNEFGITEPFTTCKAYRLRCILEKLLSIRLSEIVDETTRTEVERLQTQSWVLHKQTFQFETVSLSVGRQQDDGLNCGIHGFANEGTFGSVLDWLNSFKCIK